MNKTLLITASIFGFVAVCLGAFAAHGLENLIAPDSISTFETGVRYQMYYALILLFVGSTEYISARSKKTVFYLSVLGVLLFSGSIYGLATNELTPVDFQVIWFLTPIGGLFLIGVWAVLGLEFVKSSKA